MTERPSGNAGRPLQESSASESVMDALSDVLQAVRLTGAVFFDIQASEPWVAETPPGSSIVARLFPHADHLIPYHVVMLGSCWASLLDEPPIRLAVGDVIVFPHGDPHVVSSGPGMRGKPDLALYRRPEVERLPFAISMGASRARQAHVVCGYLACDAGPFNPLLAALPRVISVDSGTGPALGAFVQLAVAEAKTPRVGGESVLSRLSELMFVEVIRCYLQTLPADRTGWLAGLRDPSVGRALTALHRSPARAWTLGALAREAGLSRSVLSERFTQLVGQPAMQYLTGWRMQRAATQLLTGADSIATVADCAGYESEAAFSRAFKKLVGMPPSEWRRRRSLN
jgi:AraC-like DNA-binding protein